MAASRKTPIWGLPSLPVLPDLLPVEPMPYPRPAAGAHGARRMQVVQAAVEAGEATRGRPPPVTSGLVVAAQWAFFGAAALNVLLW